MKDLTQFILKIQFSVWMARTTSSSRPMAVVREFVYWYIVWRPGAARPLQQPSPGPVEITKRSSPIGVSIEPRMTSNINQPIENLMFLKVQLSKVIKNIVFLKVRTRNFDRGLPFEIAKRSSPIGVSKTSQNEHIPGSYRNHMMPPDATRCHRIPTETGHGLQQATTRTRARGEDDGSLTHSLKSTANGSKEIQESKGHMDKTTGE